MNRAGLSQSHHLDSPQSPTVGSARCCVVSAFNRCATTREREDMKVSKVFAAAALVASFAVPAAHAEGTCPNDGVVRFGVEPYESAQRLLPVYKDLADLIGSRLDAEDRAAEAVFKKFAALHSV